MANTLLSSTQVTRKALMILHQKLNFVGSINRSYDDSFAKDGAKVGDTLKIRLPNQYTTRSGAVMPANPDTSESSISLQVATQKGVDVNFSSTELSLSLDDFSDRVLDPAMSQLAASIENDALSMYKDVYQSIWNGTQAATYNQALDGRILLQRALTPTDNRTALYNSADMAQVVKDTKTLFQDSTSIAKQYREGYMGRAAGFDWAENTLLPAHTRGAANTGYTTNTQVGTLATDGTVYSAITVASGTGAMNKGDVFTIANVFSVHPETRQSTGVLQQFVVAVDFAGGAGSVSISPSIILGGARQTCVIPSTSPTAAIAFLGTVSTAVGTSLLYQKGAFAFATADLVMPKGVDFAAREVLDGVSMRIVRQYDIVNDKFPCRIDVLYGYKTIRPQLAARLHNN